MKISLLLMIFAITALLVTGCASKTDTTASTSGSVEQAADDVTAAGDLNQELDTSQADTTASELESLNW